MRTSVSVLALTLMMFLQAPSALARDACSCQHFDLLKQELDNAETLRDRHAKKAKEIADAYNNNHNLGDDLLKQYADWAEKEAGTGIVRTTPGDPDRFPFVPSGGAIYRHDLAQDQARLKDWVSDGHGGQILDFIQSKVDAYEKLHPDLCEPEGGSKFWDSLKASGPCKEVGDINWLHERSHYDTCKRKPGVQESGFIYFWRQRPPQAYAEDEVKAYSVQVAALKQLLKKVLNGAKVEYTGQIDLNYNMGPAKFSVAITSKPATAAIPADAGLDFNVKLESQNNMVTSPMRMSKDMVCTVTPTTRTEYVSVDASAGKVTVQVDRYGTASQGSMICKPGGGGSYQAPTALGGGQPVTLPLKLTSSITRDVSSKGTPADYPGISIFGVQSLNLNIVCPKPKP
jgi:hypothetical protein